MAEPSTTPSPETDTDCPAPPNPETDADCPAPPGPIEDGTPLAEADAAGDPPAKRSFGGAAFPRAGRMFTLKAVLAGILGSLWISLCAAPIDDAFKVTGYIIGNFFPVGVTAFMLVWVLVWNPIWLGLAQRKLGWRWARRLGMNSRELALIFAMTIVSCWAPASGLYRYFHRQMVMPWIQAMNASPNWQAPLATLPVHIFPDGRDGGLLEADPERRAVYDRVYIGLSQGMPELRMPGRTFLNTIFDWPWRDWMGAMAYWGPLLVLFAAAMTAMILAVHRQWAHHEQLAYPLAKINASILERDRRHVLPDIMRSRLFWGAFAGVFSLWGWNYLAMWYPDIFPPVASTWIIHTWDVLPELHRGAHGLFNFGWLTFTIIGISYFLSNEVGFTLGIGQLLVASMGMFYYQSTGSLIASDEQAAMRLGAYGAYALILLYTGRAWYGRILAKAVGWGRPDEVDSESVWATRSFLAALLGTWLWLWQAFAMDPILAIFFLLFLFTTLLIVARLVCETGLPSLQLLPRMLDPFVRLLGYNALHQRGTMFMNTLYTSLSEDHKETLSPYLTQGFYVGDQAKARLPRFAMVLLGAIVLSLVVGFVMRGHGLYYHGSALQDDYAANRMFPDMMAESLRVTQRIQAGLLPETDHASPWSRLLALRPESGIITPLLAGMAITLVIAALRFRFTWFMLHPLLALVWGTYPYWWLSQAFLIGWAAKSLVMQFGGGRVYQRGKPLVIGLIMGEAAAVAVTIIIGIVYWFTVGYATNTPPKMLSVYPG